MEVAGSRLRRQIGEKGWHPEEKHKKQCVEDYMSSLGLFRLSGQMRGVAVGN